MRTFPVVLRMILSLGFVIAGVLHFVHPRLYVRIVPDYLPAPELLVAVSGAAEVIGGVTLLLPATRRAAGVGLVALLVAVFPANVEMALHPDGAGSGLPTWALWARLPLQPALAALVWFAATRPRP